MVSLIEMGLMADKEVAARLLLQAINYVLEHDQYNCTRISLLWKSPEKPLAVQQRVRLKI